MKPITLTPAQLDAALGIEAPAEVVEACGDVPAPRFGGPCTLPKGHAEEHGNGGEWRWRLMPATGTTARWAPQPPRLECTCAERDYGLCPNCRVSG